jgi:hypothetical protein
MLCHFKEVIGAIKTGIINGASVFLLVKKKEQTSKEVYHCRNSGD